MEQITDRLYVGGDPDFQENNGKPGWSFLRCCKEGPGGHRETLGYRTQSAPKDKDYLAAVTDHGHRMALNFIDAHDPNFIPERMVRKGIEFVRARLAAGDKVLIACNAGFSRGPSTAMLYLRNSGEMPTHFIAAERMFRTLYPNYQPGIGVRQFTWTNWGKFEGVAK